MKGFSFSRILRTRSCTHTQTHTRGLFVLPTESMHLRNLQPLVFMSVKQTVCWSCLTSSDCWVLGWARLLISPQREERLKSGFVFPLHSLSFATPYVSLVSFLFSLSSAPSTLPISCLLLFPSVSSEPKATSQTHQRAA